MAHRRRVQLVTALLVGLSVALPATTEAQVLELRVGTSSLFRAHGVSVEAHGPGYTARFGVGLEDARPGLRFGFYLEAPHRGLTWRLGDQVIPFSLPTDVFSGSYSFLGRGLGAVRETGRSRLLVYGGATSTASHTPFFQTARSETPTGLLFFERQLGARARLFSRNILAESWTSIQGLEWKPNRSLRVGVAGGVGSDDPFGAASLELNQPWLTLQATYAHAGSGFRRLPAVGPEIAESDRENIRLQLVPFRSLWLTLARQHFLSPSSPGGPLLRSTVNGASFGLGLGGLDLQGGHFVSSSALGQSRAYTAVASRPLFGGIEASLSYFQTSPSTGSASRTVIARLRERVSPQLSLSQLLTRAGGHTTIAWGGELTLNRFSLGVDYQTIFLPLAPVGQPQFRQVLFLNLRFRLHDVQFEAQTNVDPLGRIRYTTHASAFTYPGLGFMTGGGQPRAKLHPTLVRGRVTDAGSGLGVDGAALRIGGELVFADSRGVFEVRKARAEHYPLGVALEEFMFPGTYAVVDAPSRVHAAPEGEEEEVAVILRRVQ